MSTTAPIYADLVAALQTAVAAAEAARQEWDTAPAGARPGKILIALAGGCPGYRPDTDLVNSTLAAAIAQLWCCHVYGPDDVLAAPDFATAQTWAKFITDWWGRKEKAADDPNIRAVVEVWPGDAQSHADALPLSIAEMTTRTATKAAGQ